MHYRGFYFTFRALASFGCPTRREFWQKSSFITHILFELCLFWYLAQSAYFWDTLYDRRNDWGTGSMVEKMHQNKVRLGHIFSPYTQSKEHSLLLKKILKLYNLKVVNSRQQPVTFAHKCYLIYKVMYWNKTFSLLYIIKGYVGNMQPKI